MEEIVRLIQQEAKKRKCSPFDVLAELEEKVRGKHKKKRRSHGKTVEFISFK